MSSNMLPIAFTVLAVLIVLMGVCVFAFTRSGRDEYDDDDNIAADELSGEEEPDEDGDDYEEADAAQKEKRALREQRKRETREKKERLAAEKAELSKKAAEAKALADVEKEAQDTADERPAELPKQSEAPNGEVSADEPVKEPEAAEPVREKPASRDSGGRTLSDEARSDKESTRRIAIPAEVREQGNDSKVIPAPAPETELETGANEAAVEAFDVENEDKDEEKGFNPVPIIVGGAVLLLALGVAAFMLVRGDFLKSRETEVVQQPPTINATVNSIRQETEFAASVECASPDVRYFAAGGKVEAVNVTEGERVQRGQTLYVLDSSSVEERISLLRQRLSNSTVTQERTVTDENSVKASASGEIISIEADEGDSVREGEALMTVSNVTGYQATFTFDADETGSISVGDAADVTVGGETVSGSVTSVSKNDAAEEGEITTYSVTVSFKVNGNAVGKSAGANVNGTRSLGSAQVRAGDRSSSTLRASVSGRLSDLRVSEGDVVGEGDIVAVITTSRTVSETKTDELEAKDINIQIEQLENELSNYTVKADVSGYVKKLYLKKGETAAVNMQAAVIVPDGSLFLKVAIDEETAGKLALPAEARYSIIKTSDITDEDWASSGIQAEYAGMVTELIPDDEEADKLNGRVEIENQTGMREGMLANARVVTYSAADALLLPADLVKDGKVSVWRANHVEEVPVQTGITTDDGYVEILGGINGVDKIVSGEAGEKE